MKRRDHGGDGDSESDTAGKEEGHVIANNRGTGTFIVTIYQDYCGIRIS